MKRLLHNLDLPDVNQPESGERGFELQSPSRKTVGRPQYKFEPCKSNPNPAKCALSKQWSCDYPIDVPATPTLLEANLGYQEVLDWSASFLCPRCFDRAVVVT